MRAATLLPAAALAAGAWGACATPRPAAKIIDLRLCVVDAPAAGPRGAVQRDQLDAYRKRFVSAVLAASSRGGRECDIEARPASDLDAGQVTLRSAYDGTVLAEISGPVDILADLAAMSVAPGTEAYRRVSQSRAAAD